MSRHPLRFHALIFRENLRVGPHSSAFSECHQCHPRRESGLASAGRCHRRLRANQQTFAREPEICRRPGRGDPRSRHRRGGRSSH